MTDPPKSTVPVRRREADETLRRVLDTVPADWRVMPIGGNAAQAFVDEPGGATKDVDLVLVALRDTQPRIPDAGTMADIVRPVLDEVRVRKDRTSVAGFMTLPVGRIKVELIRGRSKGAGGYFVSRSVLEVAASLARRDGRVLRAQPETLAFLKAWAVTDKEKLVANQKDARGYHRKRADAFREDVALLRRYVVTTERRTPDESILRRLLDATGGPRRTQVEAVLRDGGWGASLDDSTDAP